MTALFVIIISLFILGKKAYLQQNINITQLSTNNTRKPQRRSGIHLGCIHKKCEISLNIVLTEH